MKIALGVCGGIAAYKAAEICRLLQDRGVSVQVIMTEAAQRFVQPLTFAALTGNKVITSLWAEAPADMLDSSIEHIAVAQIAVLLIAPATADTLARLAQGMANDFLTTTYLATKAPVVIVPAMNVNMWEHPATRANIALLRARGNVIVDPGAGYLACGMVGEGRLADNQRILEAVLAVLDSHLHSAERKQDLANERVLITAGGTREPIDPVRFIGNRSSGKMGFALAEAASSRSAHVTVVAAATTAEPPPNIELVRVNTAEEMCAEVSRRLPQATILIKAAAVADFKPRILATQKIKRKGPMTIEFEPTADILATVAQLRSPEQIVIGFAAETEDVLEHARAKLSAKKLDAIVVNNVSLPGIGFDSDRNAVTILTSDDETEIAETSKRSVADAVLDCAVRLRLKIHA